MHSAECSSCVARLTCMRGGVVRTVQFYVLLLYTQYELYGTPYMGHLVRLVEILAKIRDKTSWNKKNMGHLKKSAKGNRI